MESNLASYKRANAHLGNQVNEQRKTILQLQEQLKKEVASPQLTNEQRALKEQLEVHIQTIGGYIFDFLPTPMVNILARNAYLCPQGANSQFFFIKQMRFFST